MQGNIRDAILFVSSIDYNFPFICYIDSLSIILNFYFSVKIQEIREKENKVGNFSGAYKRCGIETIRHKKAPVATSQLGHKI